MRLESMQLYLAPDAGVDELQAKLGLHLSELPGLQRFHLGRNLEGSWWAGTLTLDAWLDDSADPMAAAMTHIPGVVRLDPVAYKAVGGGIRAPALADGIWRTLMLRVRPQAGTAQIAELEQELLRMPAYMPGIRNWQLGRVISPSPWTHIWQQEFATVDDLLGEYLMHPYHWGWVDRRFDPEFPEWTVEAISHAFCPLERSLLARKTLA